MNDINAIEMVPINEDQFDENFVSRSPYCKRTLTTKYTVTQTYSRGFCAQYSLRFKFCIVIILFLLAIIAYLLLNPFFKDNRCLLTNRLSSTTYENLKSKCPGINENVICSYRFHPETNKCYQVEEKSPCGKNMWFILQEDDSPYGQCSCKIDNKSNRPLIIEKSGQNCFFLYEQGNCPEGEWFTYDYQNESLAAELNPTGICEESLCRNQTGDDLVPLEVQRNETKSSNETNYECVSYDKESKFCPQPKKKVDFLEESLYAQCVPFNYKRKLVTIALAGSPFIKRPLPVHSRIHRLTNHAHPPRNLTKANKV